MQSDRKLDVLVDQSEQIGVIGSPSSTTELSLDILGPAATRKLVGELALFRFQQDSTPHYALGQITEIKLRNVWHEDPTMRSLIRQRGRVDAVSERQDTHQGQMTISAVFRQGGPSSYEPSMFGTVPSTGTGVHLVTDDVLDEVLHPYREQVFYLGRVYGSTPKLPVWFKHFDRGPQGAGEAYHLGIFGRTGSGKSVLAKMILLAYARYPKMALLVIDPQGELTADMRKGGAPGEFPLPVGELARWLGKPVAALSVRNLILDTWELFEQILAESPFFEQLTIPRGENRQLACSVLVDRLRKLHVTLKDLHRRESFDKAWKSLADPKVQQLFYRSEGPRARFDTALADADPAHFFAALWGPLTELFREDRPEARSIARALGWLLNPDVEQRPILVLDLSGARGDGLYWNERIQALVIKQLLESLTRSAEHFYKENQSLNALVVIDEAQRLAPRHVEEDTDHPARDVCAILVDAARTTRKYGLGWLFISQTLASLHPEILRQLRILFFGFGLGLGMELDSLRQLVGSSGRSLDLYHHFRDPHSSFDSSSRQYSFMTIGPVSPLSFAGTPLFFNAFNRIDDFLSANRLPSMNPKS